MDLPSSREIELETSLRERDAQLAELTNELSHLRIYLTTQPSPSTTDPVTLPPPLVSVLLPHIQHATPSGAAASNTVVTALTQRVRLLQEENDELYDILKHGETGKLKEEVRGLRRVVERLEGALRDSHQIIVNLTAERDKLYESLLPPPRQNNHHAHSQSPPISRTQPSSSSNGSSKLPPTGPRAHKKPRLSEPHASPARSNASLPRHHGRDRSPRPPAKGGASHSTKMELDDDARTRPRSPVADRERGGERDRDRDRDRVRDRERERERDRMPRRNGGHGGGRRRAMAGSYAGADRTLAERMGL